MSEALAVCAKRPSFAIGQPKEWKRSCSSGSRSWWSFVAAFVPDDPVDLGSHLSRVFGQPDHCAVLLVSERLLDRHHPCQSPSTLPKN